MLKYSSQRMQNSCWISKHFKNRIHHLPKKKDCKYLNHLSGMKESDLWVSFFLTKLCFQCNIINSHVQIEEIISSKCQDMSIISMFFLRESSLFIQYSLQLHWWLFRFLLQKVVDRNKQKIKPTKIEKNINTFFSLFISFHILIQIKLLLSNQYGKDLPNCDWTCWVRQNNILQNYERSCNLSEKESISC